ncbi:uncharacterized protein LOC132719431 [Ruditapes philippinarum]|uniref:uncharacterized protein LOC132719431 n=1 Tax=Ruditapes philippinarum TaxID=129788 RepID=UPI00295A6060|nr:uncharacterized protein LOC132719431 [Ruditapes philippinarum]
MSSISLDDNRLSLYGPGRNLRFQNIKDNLTKSHVLQDGEYNFTSNKLKRGDIWKTSHSTDFSGAVLDPNSKLGTSSQLVHHFDMGNMSGKFLDKDIFRRSTTMTDFRKNKILKPEIQGERREINWPDMAPRYLSDRRVGPSEYTTSFIKNLRHRSAPNYPRVDTSKLQLPLDPTKFWRQRNTNFSLGSDNDGLISEQQRAFGRGSRAFQPENAERNAASDINKSMKEMDKVSHVFRGGDYNGIVGDFTTVCNNDYGPRTVPPGEASLQILLPHQKKKPVAGEEEEEDEENQFGPYANTNQLQKFAREITVPTVFKEASDGRTYQTNAHFHFGHDAESGHSVYAKDFLLSAMVDRAPPIVKPTPSAGKVFYFLLCGRRFNGLRLVFYHMFVGCQNSKGKTALEMNLDRRDTDNVVFSFDLGRHRTDRQKSLNHSDYKGPPKEYCPPKMAERHDVYVDYLQTDDALPYPAPPKDTSEAAHNFAGIKLRGKSAGRRRKKNRKESKVRWTDGRTTHFTVGYEPFDFSSETQMKFQGDKKNDMEIPAAGKVEVAPPRKAQHLTHSENILDLKAADPFITNTRESLPARMNYIEPYPEQSNTTSVMMKDYGPMVSRSLTDAQLRVIDKYDRVTRKEISQSHLFHEDTSGRNNFRTTAMEDFIMPETMTGRKFLAAR